MRVLEFPDEPTPRQALLDALVVERFTAYKPPSVLPVTPDAAAQHLRLVIDNTPDHRTPRRTAS